MLFAIDHLIFPTLGVEIGVIDRAFLIDRDGSGDTTIRAFLRAIKKALEGVRLNRNIAFHNEQSRIGGDGLFLTMAEQQEIIGRGMIGEFGELHHLHPEFGRGLVKTFGILGRREIVEDGVGIWYGYLRPHDGLHRFDGAIDAVFNGGDDMELLHEGMEFNG